MQISKYLKVFPSDDNRLFLFSTKRLSTVQVTREVYQAMQSGTLSADSRKTLAELGFLVDDRDEERREMQRLIEDANRDRTVCSSLVVLNFDCNLDCIYCFEGTQKGKKYMTPQTADAIVDFLAKKSYEKGKFLRVAFYGGEPLMSMDRIKEISGKLIERSGGQRFVSSLVTNGLLLTRKRVEELLPFGLEQAKVTVDGIRENHDKYRPLRSGGGSFDTIVGNIKNVSDLIQIQLGGNYTEENYRDFPKMLDYFLEVGIKPESLRFVLFAPITKTHQEYQLPEFQDVGCEASTEPWIHEASAFLRSETQKRGFKVPKLRPGTCSVEFQDDIVINYNGDCYKCPAFIGQESLKVGSVFDGVQEYGELYGIGHWKNQDCMNCEYLPLCFGGCRFMMFKRDGNMKDVDCRKGFYDTSLERIVKDDMKHRHLQA